MSLGSDGPDQDVESLEDTGNLDMLKRSNEIERDPVPIKFILTKFVKKQSEIYHVAKILNKIDEEFEVIFFKKTRRKKIVLFNQKLMKFV